MASMQLGSCTEPGHVALGIKRDILPGATVIGRGALIISSVWLRLRVWRDRRRAGRDLDHLDGYWLRDIGIERRPPEIVVEQIRACGRMWV